ncbi:MAG: maf [Pedosphaera sp.]|nr:maf [Pedosphaera sp.]
MDFEVLPSDASELHNEHLTAGETSQINAYRKARAVAKKFPDALVMGADTLVYLDTKLFGKPTNHEDAYRMLKQLQGQTHQVVTGVCLMQLRCHRQKVFAESTEVKFRVLTTQEIKNYLDRINPLDKAGGYAIQENGDKIIENISGSYSNVMGLPLERLKEELPHWEVPLGVH